MTDKEFKRLTRAQLLDIIYEFQMKVDELTEQKGNLEKALEDRRVRISNAGNLAKAVLEINDCFLSTQKAADQYLNEIKAMQEETKAECERMLAQARAEADKTLSDAQAEAAEIVAEVKRSRSEYEAAVAAVMEEYGQTPTDNG